MRESDEKIRRAKLKKYLTEEELLLCDTDRERLLIQRELLEIGALGDMDLLINKFDKEAKKSAAKRNGFDLSTWISILFSKN
jgi:hypothetical protein